MPSLSTTLRNLDYTPGHACGLKHTLNLADTLSMKSADREKMLREQYDTILSELCSLDAGDERILPLSHRLELYAIILAEELWSIDDEDEILAVLDPLMASSEKQVQQYRDGNDKLWGFFYGRTMRELNGRADVEVLNAILEKKLKG